MLRSLWTTVAPLLVLGLGLMLTIAGGHAYWRSHSSKSWPASDGVILQSAVESTHDDRYFYLRVLYRFDVGDRTYSGERIRWKAKKFLSESRAKQEQKLYEAGRGVQVRYDPDDPSHCVLIPGGDEERIPGILLGLALIAYGSWKSFRRFVVGRKRIHRFPELNWSFRRPNGWVRHFETGSNRPQAVFQRRGITLSLVGSRSTSSSLHSSQKVASMRIEIIGEAADKHRVLRREPATCGDLEGVVLVVQSNEGRDRTTYACFGRGHRGFTYEVLVHAPQDRLDEDEALRILEDVTAGLTILDPDRSSFSELPVLRSGLQSRRYGYSFEPEGDGWRVWHNLATDHATMDSGALHTCGGILSHASITIPDQNVTFDDLCLGLLGLYHIERKDAGLVRVQEEERGSTVWRRYRYQREVGDNSYAYVMQVFRWGKIAHLMVMSTEPGNPALEPVFEEALAALNPPPTDHEPPTFDALNPRERQRHVTALHAIARNQAADQRHAESTGTFRRLLELTPDDEDLFYALLLSLTRRDAYAEALEIWNKEASRFSGSLPVRSFEPFLFSRLGRDDEAIQAFQKVFDAGWRDAEDQRELVRLLLVAKRHEEARQTIQDWIQEGDQPWLRRLIADTHSAEGDLGTAIDQLRELADKHPSDLDTQLALAKEYDNGERYEDARQLCEKLIEAGHTQASVYFTRGVAESRLNWYPQAKRSLEAALRDEPGNAMYQRWLDHVTHQLGQGSNRLLRRTVEAVELPPDENPRPTDPASRTGAVVLEQLMGIHYTRGEWWRMTFRRRILVLTEPCAQRLSTMTVPFDPEAEDLYINELRVRDEEGVTVSEGVVEDYFVHDDEDDRGGTAKIANLPVRGLRPGVVLELTYTRRRSCARQGFPYRCVWLYYTEPVLRSVLEIRGDLDGLITRATEQVTVRRSERSIRCTAEDVAPMVREPYAVPPYEWLPMVWIAEPERSWEEVVREYLDRISDRFDPIPGLEKKAAELVEGLDDDERRAAALAAFVRRELTYKSIQFGPQGYVPERADRVLESQFGDCKAHSILFLHLMRAAGMRCVLALVDTGALFWPEAPTRWQFDHMINYCPDLGGGRFVDCVDKGHAVSNPVPNSLARQVALILDDQQPRTQAIPDYGQSDDQIRIERTVQWEKDGTLRFVDTLTLVGGVASNMRSWLLQQERASLPSRFEAALAAEVPGIEVLSVEDENLRDYEEPIVVRSEFRLRSALDRVGEQLIGKLPIVWEKDYLSAPTVNDRLSPFRIMVPYTLDFRIHFEAPADRLTQNEGRTTGKDDFAEWTCETTCAADGLRVHFLGQTLTGNFPPDRYNDLRDSMHALLESLQARLTLDLANLD